jgi:hypothetical protein
MAKKKTAVAVMREVVREPSVVEESSGYEGIDNFNQSGFDNDTEEVIDLGEELIAEERVAVFDFEPEDEDQIALVAGDKFIVEEIDDEWSYGENLETGETGWVPIAFLSSPLS